jgi:hypothetical protein
LVTKWRTGHHRRRGRSAVGNREKEICHSLVGPSFNITIVTPVVVVPLLLIASESRTEGEGEGQQRGRGRRRLASVERGKDQERPRE